MITDDRFLTISTDEKQNKKKVKRPLLEIRSICFQEGSSMDSYSKNEVDINKVITNLTSIRNSVDFCSFSFQIAVVSMLSNRISNAQPSVSFLTTC